MKKGNLKVEQITYDSEVVLDYDQSLSKSELQELLCNSFPNSWIENGFVYGKYCDKTYCIYYKNITYLGTPHPLLKKRIQIGDNFKNLYIENKQKNIITFLLGVYSYEGINIFVDFDISNYCVGKSHNSSAHVYINDLKNTLRYGVFQKKDARKNIITGFMKGNVPKYLKSKIEGDFDLRLDFVKYFDDFFEKINKTWYGIDCYKEMGDSNFPNKYQPEWPGFYFEYKFSKYICLNKIKNHIQYSQNKKKDDIDLDLYFPQISCYSDLKCHSNDSKGIPGNDLPTIQKVLKFSSVYYIVCNHNTKRDKDCNNEVTIYWNRCLNKTKLLSYSNKMKNTVFLTSYRILEINRYNMKYLDVFNQGHNSNGKPRVPKIQIKDKNINNFLIHEVIF